MSSAPDHLPDGCGHGAQRLRQQISIEMPLVGTNQKQYLTGLTFSSTLVCVAEKHVQTPKDG